MSGYSEEDDEADRAYWSQIAHGGAGDDHDHTEESIDSANTPDLES